MEGYNVQVLTLFANPVHVGSLPVAADVLYVQAGVREQGVEFKVWLQVQQDKVQCARFLAFACPHMIAAAEQLMCWVEGRDREALLQWEWQPVAQQLAIPAAKRGRLLVLQDAIRALAAQWPKNR